MAPSDWEADEMLDVYIHDYMVKKKLYSTADSFMTDGKVSHAHAAIEAPGGALFQMWSAFLDMYSDKTKKKQSDVEFGLNGYIHDYLVKKNLHYVALSFMTELKVSPDPVEINAPGGFLSKWWSVFWAFFIARSRSITNEKHAAEEASPRQLPLDPSTVYGQGVLQSKPGMGSAGLNPGGWALPLQGWPLTGIDNMPQGFDPQVQNAFLQNQGQFQLPPQQQQQQTMARDQGQGNMTNSSLYGQQNANDGSISYPMPSNSSNPLTPSTLTPIEGVAITGNMQHGNNMPKGPMMYGSDAIGGLPSSANQMTRGDIEAFEDVGNLEDNAESFSVGGLASSANQLAVMEAFEDVDMESVFKAIDWNPSEEQQIQMNQPNMDPRMALLKPGTTNHGEMVQGSPQGGVSAALQQPQSHKPICNCKKTKCLQLYCDCFAAGVFCIGPACSCVDCCNKPAHEDTVMESRKKIESRDPLAFAPRIISRSSDSVEQTREDDGSKTSDSKRHIRGCNCKKSNCQKNYCECFKGGVACTANCRCKSCKNTFDPMVKA